MLNVIGRCTFDDIEVRYSKRLGEIAYYCHNNLFHNIRASYAYREGLSSGNGWGCYEGAHDNTFENILLNHGKAGTRAWVIGAGRRNNLSNSEIIVHAQTNGQTIVGLLSPGWDFKPKDCVVANNKIKISGSPVGIPFAIEVDSGGPYGGGNMIWGNLIEGMPLVAPIGLSRIDKRDGLGSQQGCENNIIEGNIHTVSHVSGTMAIPIISMIVEYNNESPVGNPLSQKIIDPAIKPNLIRSNLTRQRQSSVSDYDLGIFASQEETVVRSYTVPRYSVGTHHRWLIAASGRVEVNQTHDNKHIRVYILGSQLFDIEFSPSETGSWSLCIEIAGKHVSDNIIDNNTVISRKFVHYTFQKNETISSSVVEYMHDSNVSDFVLELRTQISNPSNIVQDKVIVDKFIVTPAGEDYSYINWELLKAVWGDYPKLVYPA